MSSLYLNYNSTKNVFNEIIGDLRVKVANHFKEEADSISLLKPGKTSTFLNALGAGLERLENDNMTLRLAKFSPHDVVIARKKDPPYPPPGGIKSIKVKFAGPIAEDLLEPTDLQTDLLTVLTPLHWLSSSAEEDQSPRYTRNSLKGEKPDGSLLIDVFLFPPFTLPSRADMTLIPHRDILYSSAQVPGSNPLPLDPSIQSGRYYMCAQIFIYIDCI
jgi:hypothetical protein